MLHLLFLSNTFSQETYHPHAPISFAYFTLLQNVFVLRLGCVQARTHTPTSHRHTAGVICHHNSILSLQVLDRKGIKAKTGTVYEVRRGVTKTRYPICSHSLTSQCRSWTPSLLCFGSLRMTSQGDFGWKYVGKREVKKKGLFYF